MELIFTILGYVVLGIAFRIARRKWPIIDKLIALECIVFPIFVWITQDWIDGILSFFFNIIAVRLLTGFGSSNSTSSDYSTSSSVSYSNPSESDYERHKEYERRLEEEEREEYEHKENERKSTFESYKRDYEDYEAAADQEYSKYQECMRSRDNYLEEADCCRRRFEENQDNLDLSHARSFLEDAKSEEYDAQDHLQRYNEYKRRAEEAYHEMEYYANPI